MNVILFLSLQEVLSKIIILIVFFCYGIYDEN